MDRFSVKLLALSKPFELLLCFHFIAKKFRVKPLPVSQDGQEGALAGPICPDQAVSLTNAELHPCVLKQLSAVECHREVVNFDVPDMADLVINSSISMIKLCCLMFVRVGGPLKQCTEKYDSSPESCALGAVYRLLLLKLALNYCEYKAKQLFC